MISSFEVAVLLSAILEQAGVTIQIQKDEVEKAGRERAPPANPTAGIGTAFSC
jgi:hypothetical protein